MPSSEDSCKHSSLEDDVSDSESGSGSCTLRQQAIFLMDKWILASIISTTEHVTDWITNVVYENLENPLRLIVGIQIKNSATASSLPILVLYVNTKCLVFQFAYARQIPPYLCKFLSGSLFTFVGVGVRPKLDRMEREFGLGGRTRYVDLASLAAERYRRPELKEAGPGQLRKFFYGSDVAKHWVHVDDDWDKEELTYDQICEVCAHVYTCHEIGNYLVFPIKKEIID